MRGVLRVNGGVLAEQHVGCFACVFIDALRPCPCRRGPLQMRYGLDDGEEKTLEEVGRAFNVSAFAHSQALLGWLGAQALDGARRRTACCASGCRRGCFARPAPACLVLPRPWRFGGIYTVC